MNPTEYFRFVHREVETTPLRPEGVRLVMRNAVLQQWWESEKMIANPPGEWRDVPLLPEDDKSPYDPDGWP